MGWRELCELEGLVIETKNKKQSLGSCRVTIIADASWHLLITGRRPEDSRHSARAERLHSCALNDKVIERELRKFCLVS
jgi:hypothetical protein